jgi:DNA repair protein RecO (recombination protein O)
VLFRSPNKTLHKVNEFSGVHSHQLLREDLDRIALASTAVEAVALGVEDSDPFPDLYRLLAETLDHLEVADRPAVVLQGFFLHLLRLLGYRPEFSECVRCRAPLLARVETYLSPASGGAVCASCRPGATDAFAASVESLGFLRGAGGSTLRLMDRIALPPATLREVTETLQAFLRQVLGRSLRSADFLSRL